VETQNKRNSSPMSRDDNSSGHQYLQNELLLSFEERIFEK